MAKVKFKPTDSMLIYDSIGLHCEFAGEYECSADKAAQVVEDFPANFSAVTEKGAAAPDHNKMEKGPSKNK